MISPSSPIAHLLLFRFLLDRPAEFRFFHSPTVVGFLHARLGTRADQGLPRGVRQLAVESGRTRYKNGNYYHLGVALLPDSELTVRALIERLGQRSGDPSLRDVPLGPRTRLVSVTDLVSGHDITQKGDAEPLTYGDLCKAAASIAESRELTVRFDSPLLILRQPVQRRDTFLDEQTFDPGVFLDRVARAVEIGWPTLGSAPPAPGVTLRANHMVRAETYYRGANRENGGKILPGATGQIELEFATPVGQEWASRLLLAGLYGVGKSSAMGQGRFHVEDARVHPRWPPPAARTFCQRMADDEGMMRARESLERAGTAPGVDDVERADFLDALTFRLPLLKEALASGEHRPNALRGLLIQRSDGKIRPLAIPTLEDRYLQRAAVEELGPALDELFEETSFAYRRGLSRRNAEQRVRQAHDEGYRHVFEADLRAFFDRVDWNILRHRLQAYLGDDPCVDLMMRWVQAPVEFGEQVIQRTRGLPQGAVVSPLLANLYLDSFDEAIEAQGFRLVRYADDFVVLCKSTQDAARAREVVERELARVKLELAAEKTGLTDFGRGFEFLGYIFTHSLSLQKQREPSNARVLESPDELDSKALTPETARGWLVEWLSMGPTTPDVDVQRFQPALVPSSPARRAVNAPKPTGDAGGAGHARRTARAAARARRCGGTCVFF